MLPSLHYILSRFYIACFHSLNFFVRLTLMFFFFNDTATTEIYTLSLHDALPISCCASAIARWDSVTVSIAAETIGRSEEHTSELQSHSDLVCRLLLEKKKKKKDNNYQNHISARTGLCRGV